MADAMTPKTLLVAALGGEGGGVLADWIVAAALRAGLPAQATSVPGVAQRTGATSYYIELMPLALNPELEPVFALVPTAGRVDVVISSELLESGRLLERGFISPDRTLFISSSSRVLTTMEKMQMGDGRFDGERIHGAARELAKTYVALDLEKLAQENGTVVSATMFGALAGAGAFPWDRANCEAIIAEGGRGVKASLAGYSAAFDAVQDRGTEVTSIQTTTSAVVTPEGFTALPRDVSEIIAHGVARVRDYQDEAYGETYLERVRTLVGAVQVPSDPVLAHGCGVAAGRLAIWMA